MNLFKVIAICLMLTFMMKVHSLDLNRASAFELEAIRGIGERMAQEIVSNRKEHGSFKSWIDFKERIQGIGDANLFKMKTDGLNLDVQINGLE